MSRKYTPVWNGLWHQKHHERLGSAWMLFGFLLSKVNKYGLVVTRYKDISKATGTPIRTLQSWMAVLKSEGYVSVKKSRSMVIKILKFRSLKTAKPSGTDGANPCGTKPDKTPQDVAAPGEDIPQDPAGQYRNGVAAPRRNVAAPDSVNGDKQRGSGNSLNLINKSINVLRPSQPSQESGVGIDTF